MLFALVGAETAPGPLREALSAVPAVVIVGLVAVPLAAGATLGQRLFGCGTARPDGAPPSPAQAILLALITPIAGLVAALTAPAMLIRPRQALGAPHLALLGHVVVTRA